MNRLNYSGRTLLNFLTFNIGWWACAIGAKQGHPWLGPALMPVWLGMHLYYSPVARGESLFLAGIAIVGFGLDTALIHAGLFATVPASAFAPLWLVSMWVLLGQTFENMLAMRRNIYLLCVMGAMSGPLSYYAGESMGVLFYARPLWLTLPVHAILWSLLIPLLFWLRDFARTTMHPNANRAPAPAARAWSAAELAAAAVVVVADRPHEGPPLLAYSAAARSDPGKP